MAEYELGLTQSEGLTFVEPDETVAEQERPVEDVLETGECPWCDYDGGHAYQHAPKAHPQEWTDYKEVRE